MGTMRTALKISDSDLRAVLAKLPSSRLRRTCELVWLRGRSSAQASAAQGVTARSVEKRLERARRRLRAAGIEPPDARRRARRSAAQQWGLSQDV
jgi:DNA-directed RNA polymerase specialized sigma24 family protein